MSQNYSGYYQPQTTYGPAGWTSDVQAGTPYNDNTGNMQGYAHQNAHHGAESGYSVAQAQQPMQQQAVYSGYNQEASASYSSPSAPTQYNYQAQPVQALGGYGSTSIQQPQAYADPYQEAPQAHSYTSQSPQSQMAASMEPESVLAARNAVDDNGLRWTWSTYPNTAKVKGKETSSVASIPLPPMVVHMSCMYTPLKPLPESSIVQGNPSTQGLLCANCGSFFNRHSYRDDGRSWVCLSCLRRNAMPALHDPQHPALLQETVEYVLPRTSSQSTPNASENWYPTFIFVIDICLPREELDALKGNVLRCLQWLPPRSLVGLVIFGARATLWELRPAPVYKSYVLRGESAYTRAEMVAMLQVSTQQPVQGRFLVPREECEGILASILQDVNPDTSVLPPNKRPLRATGTAVDVATFVMEALQDTKLSTLGHQGAGKIMLFTGGPCTRGPGAVVSVDKEQMMRSHRDIIDDSTPHYRVAYLFYSGIEGRLAAVRSCLDVFAQSFDQVGIMEMRGCVNKTGGLFICGDAFDHDMFSLSLQRYFERMDLQCHAGSDASRIAAAALAPRPVRCGFGVQMELHTSADTLVSGILGPCNVNESANKAKSHRVASPIRIGVGDTMRWCVSTMDHEVTLAVLFDTATLEVVNSSSKVGGDARQADHTGALSRSGHTNRFIQFVTRYRTPEWEERVRVTSIVQPVAPPTADAAYFARSQAFDQTCASTVIARMAVSILEQYPNKWNDTRRWIDTLLVRFVRRYGAFTPGQPNSLRLEPCLTLFPSFMFNLRRSEYFMVINISPDESTFKRHWLMREPVDNCVRMIQPTLDSYDLKDPYAAAVPLDSGSLRHDNIVLMDAYFNVHIMWGTTIFEWIKAGYHELPDYAHFATLLEAAETDAQLILAHRYPYPRFSRTDAEGSEARHIKTRVNPAKDYQGAGSDASYPGGATPADASEIIYTDDASIMKFMMSLKQAVVATETDTTKGKSVVSAFM